MCVGVRNWVTGLSNSSSSFPEKSLEKDHRLSFVLEMTTDIEVLGGK